MARADLVKLPVHSRRALVINLHAVNADIARACLRVARVHVCQSDEPPAVFWPAFENRQIPQRKSVSIAYLMDDFMACGLAH